jgi:glycosyltransferase involved in cell wall biosynthesis
MTTLVVIPAYNEAATLAMVASGALAHADRVVVIDDGSTDGTADVVLKLPVLLIAHMRNEGKSASLIDGFAWAIDSGATQVLTMDADGQHGAADIPRLLRAAEMHPRAIVIGARTREAAAAPRARRIANRLADFGGSWASGHRVLDSQSGQRVYPAALLRALDLRKLSRGGFTLESELVIEAARLGYATVSVPIDAVYDPVARKSHFRPVRDISAIFFLLARKLARNAFNLPGLWTSLRERATTFDDRAAAAAVVRAVEPAVLRGSVRAER